VRERERERVGDIYLKKKILFIPKKGRKESPSREAIA
jgi:hypothetical protein